MNRGVPPTALNARTGEFTPPGVTASARSKRAADWAVGGAVGRAVEAAAVGSAVTRAFSPAGGPDHEPGPGGPGVRRATRRAVP